MQRSRREAPSTVEPIRPDADALGDLLAAFGDLVVVRTIEGAIRHANDAFCRTTGCVEPLGRMLLDFAAEDQEAGGSEDRLVLTTPAGPRVFEWREAMTRDRATGRPLVHAIGRPVAAPNDLGDSGGEAAPGVVLARSRFMAMVSHELRTPLNGILGMSELLAHTTLTREQESYLDAVRHSGNLMMALVGDLLDFSGMENGHFELDPQPGEVRGLVERVVELSAAAAHEKGIELAAHVAPDVPASIVVDHTRLRQIVFNLVGNAVKFTEEGGVLVEVAVEGARMRLSVSDTGPGIAEADRRRIFAEFEQLGGPGGRRGGVGLGLAISARLVAAMDGTLDVVDNAGGGSRFIVDLPLRPAAGTQPPIARRLPESHVLILAPAGATATVLARLITEAGGRAERESDPAEAHGALARLGGGATLTDVIVDNRMSDAARALSAELDAGLDPVWTLMVTPNERDMLRAVGRTDYSAWLIRPIRPISLARVLARETGGHVPWHDEPTRTREDGFTIERPSGRALSVLLAEDNPVNTLLVRSVLEQAGHVVTCVTNGEALVETVFDGGDFDVVLTDLAMPVLDGEGAIRVIREVETEAGQAGVPVYVLSADGQAGARRRALAAGADGYVEKPVDPRALLQTVAQAAIQR
ncbi:ATP-binding protein [Pararhizobium mangrovi]|uniref:histidine kinase n=1 Tax=Pararhizobium mangrovi TaxID=2590452 RepID=A0A506U1U7_9HYPH|nr:ATP-binding protein [Pararhizobium mangrovi]TPW28342.1 response regulator [Pararhizobium mangrovi]